MIRIVLSRRAAVLGLAVLLAVPASPAQVAEPASAKAFVEAVYKHYSGDSKDASGIPLDGATAVRRYFTPALAAMILKDRAAAKKRDDLPSLDGDAFVGHQDWDIANLAIDVQETGDQATATLRFTDLGDPETVVLSLRKIGKEWRIDDVRYADASTLRGLFVTK